MIGCYRGYVAVMAAGVYLAFEGGPDASAPDGAGIGPYDEIVLRGARAVGEREGLGKVILLRFADDEVAGQPAVPDLGPFAVVVVGTHQVRGDAETLAVRVSRISPWQLTDRAGTGFQGAMKQAIVFI